MTDRGERRVRKWALRRNGDPLEPRDVVELVFELDEDHADDMTEVRALIGGLVEDVSDLSGNVLLHHEWADRDLKPAIETLHHDVEELKKGTAHEAFHATYVASLGDPRRGDDPPDSEFTEKRESAFPVLTTEQRSMLQILSGWSLLKKGLAIALTAAIIGMVGLGITYLGASIASNRAEQNVLHYEETHSPAPSVTVTASPAP